MVNQGLYFELMGSFWGEPTEVFCRRLGAWRGYHEGCDPTCPIPNYRKDTSDASTVNRTAQTDGRGRTWRELPNGEEGAWVDVQIPDARLRGDQGQGPPETRQEGAMTAREEVIELLGKMEHRLKTLNGRIPPEEADWFKARLFELNYHVTRLFTR